MPRDLLEEQGISPTVSNRQPVDLLEQAGISMKNSEDSRNNISSIISNILASGGSPGTFLSSPEGQRIGKDVLSGLGQDVQGALNVPHNITNLINPSLAQRIPISNVDINQKLGLDNSNPVDKMLQGTVSYLPYALGGEALLGPKIGESLLGKMGTQGAIGATYGFTQNQDHPVKNAIESGLLNAATEGTFNAGKIGQYFRPKQYVQEILNSLGGGKSIPENASSLGNLIKNSYQQQKDKTDAIYNNIRDSVGSGSIYDSGIESQYKNLPANILKFIKKDPDLSELHKDLLSNGNFDLAHKYQSQMGFDIRSLQKQKNANFLDSTGQDKLKSLLKARTALQSDIAQFLNNKDPNLSNQYQTANNLFAKNVMPYRMLPGISNVIRSTNPKIYGNKIESIFSNPNTQEEQSKIMNDLGEDGKNQMLYSILGKSKFNTPEKIVKKSKELEEKGFSNNFPTNYQDRIDTLKNRINLRDWVQRGAGAGLGYGLAHQLLSGIPALEIGGAVGAGVVNPYVMAALQRKFPIEKIGNALAKTLKPTKPVIHSAIVGNFPGNNQ